MQFAKLPCGVLRPPRAALWFEIESREKHSEETKCEIGTGILRIDAKIFHRDLVAGEKGRADILVRDRLVEMPCQHIGYAGEGYLGLE